MIFRLLLFMILLMSDAVPGWAATYYVTKNGSDANSCATASTASSVDSASAKLTVQAAVNCAASPGDTVQVNDSSVQTYFEFVIPGTSGSSGNPIIIKGKRGGSGQYLTIMHTAPTVLSGWVSAAGEVVGGETLITGVYKVARPSFPNGPVTTLTGDACNMIVDGKSIWNISYNHIEIADDGHYLNRAHSNTDFWDAAGGIWANYGSYLYIHLANGANPNTKTIRVGPWRQHCLTGGTTDWAAFLIRGKNYITIQDFEFVGGSSGVTIDASSSNIVVQSNYFHDGSHMLAVISGSNITMSGNTIDANHMTAATYRYGTTGDPAASIPYNCTEIGFNTPDREGCLQYIRYNLDKEISSQGDQYRFGITMLSGSDFIVDGNTITNVTTGINADYVSLEDVTIRNNSVRYTGGSCIGMVSPATGVFTIANNELAYCAGALIRWRNIENTSASLQVYIYGNRMWNRGDIGSMFYMHPTVPTNFGSNPAKVRVYHNTLLGGYTGPRLLGVNATNTWSDTIFVNNLIQLTSRSRPMIYDSNGVTANSSGMKAWDYNWEFSSAWSAGFKYTNNIEATSPALTHSDSAPPASISGWTLPVSSPARNKGVDISKSFTINGITYPALPGFSPGYFSGTNPDPGAVQYSAGVSAPAAPTGLRVELQSGPVAELEWEPNSETTIGSYRVYRSQTMTFGSIPLASTGSGVTVYYDSALAGGATYYYVVTAVNAPAFGGAESAQSNIVSVMIPTGPVPNQPPFVDAGRDKIIIVSK